MTLEGRPARQGPRFVSLYSGAGGLDIGFVRAGFTPVWANDIESSAVATYNELFRDFDHRAVEGNIDQLLERGDVPGRGDADFVIGGPPCQGFSVAGKMNPHDERSRHVWRFLDVVERVQPVGFCMENVSALAWNRRWTALLDGLVARAEEQLRYRTTLLVRKASHFGVPQNRERMFLVGLRDDVAVTLKETTAEKLPTVGDALAELPPYG